MNPSRAPLKAQPRILQKHLSKHNPTTISSIPRSASSYPSKACFKAQSHNNLERPSQHNPIYKHIKRTLCGSSDAAAAAAVTAPAPRCRPRRHWRPRGPSMRWNQRRGSVSGTNSCDQRFETVISEESYMRVIGVVKGRHWRPRGPSMRWNQRRVCYHLILP